MEPALLSYFIFNRPNIKDCSSGNEHQMHGFLIIFLRYSGHFIVRQKAGKVVKFVILLSSSVITLPYEGNDMESWRNLFFSQ
jgi:hypothetical protein